MEPDVIDGVAGDGGLARKKHVDPLAARLHGVARDEDADALSRENVVRLISLRAVSRDERGNGHAALRPNLDLADLVVQHDGVGATLERDARGRILNHVRRCIHHEVTHGAAGDLDADRLDGKDAVARAVAANLEVAQEHIPATRAHQHPHAIRPVDEGFGDGESLQPDVFALENQGGICIAGLDRKVE